MYPVSTEYLNEITQDGRKYFLSGTIKLKDTTTITLSEDTVMQGSLSLEENIVSGADIEIGSVNISKLNLTLKTSPDDPYNLDGAVVSPVFNLQLANGTEQVPLGVFSVSEVNRVVGGSVSLSAYDNMAKLDKSILQVTQSGRPRDIILSICSVCGVEIATNGTTFSTFPNYSVTLTIPDDSNIKSCRDLLMWICQTIGCSARFDRAGKLEIKLITGGASVKSIPPQNVYSETISDFMTKVTRLSTVNGDNEISVGADGQTLELSENPLYHNKTATQITAAMTNILNKLTLLEYVPAEISYIGDPALQAGDIIGLEVEGGVKKIWITSHIWRYGGKHTIKSEGSKYTRGNVSQAEKSLQFVSKKADKATNQATLADEKAQEAQDLVEQAKSEFNTAISDLNGELGSVTSQIGDIKSDVTGIQSEYATLHAEIYDTTDGIVKRMTSVETDIGIIAGQIASKVSQDEYDEYVSITGDVITQIESDLSLVEQTASNISATVAGQSVLIDGLQTSYADQQAQINVQAGLISQTVTKTEFNNLQIGGRNLLLDSGKVRSTTRTIIVDTYESLSDYVGEDVVVSFDLMINENGVLRDIFSSYPYQNNGISIGTGMYARPTEKGVWQRFSIKTYVMDWGNNNVNWTRGAIAFHDTAGDNSYKIRNIKIEKGTKATDWTPAPEDVEKQIDTAYDNATSYADSKISQTAESINLSVAEKVGKTEIISTINQSAETISIDASKINLNGVVTANNNFKINLDGSMETVAGKIANFEIKNNMLYSGSGNNTILLKSSGKIRLAVGLPLSMIQAGSSAVDGNYHAVSTATYLTQNGLFKSGNAEITGKITTNNLTATGGEIAGWGISTNYIASTDTVNKRYTMLNSGKGGSEFALVVGMPTEGSNPTPAAYIKHDGEVKFSKGEFNGKIVSSSGSIGGWTIGSSNIRSGSGNNIVFLSGGTSDYALWAGNANATIAPTQIKKDGTIISSGSTVSTHINGGSLKFRYSSTVAGGISATNISGVGVALNLECTRLSINGLRGNTQTISVSTPRGVENLAFVNGIFIGVVVDA